MSNSINSIKEQIKDLIADTIKKSGHHPFLFVGAGISKRYANTPKWDELLRHFCTECSGDEFLYDSYANQIEDADYYGLQPQIATLLEKDYNKAFFENEKFNEFKLKYKTLIQNHISPFKIAIAEYLKDITYNEDDLEIRLLNKISKRNISGVITTNYDMLLENIFDGYHSYVGQEELIFANLSGIGEIYKIHGSVSDPQSILITANDYKKFEEKSAYLIAKILTVFIEYPMIFLGYSLQDKNIKDILKVIANCLSQEKLEHLKDRMIFVSHSDDESISEFAINFENGNVIKMKQISTRNFMQIYEAIDGVKAKYSPRVLRELRKDIYELANEENPSGRIVATGFENLETIDKDTNFILGIGVSGPGHLIKTEQIYEDIVFDNQYLNPKIVIEEYLPELLKVNSGGLPMYKYIANYNGELFERVKENSLKYVNVDAFLNDGLRKQKENYKKSLIDVSVENIIDVEGMDNAYKRLVLLDAEEFDVDKVERYLKDLMKGRAREILQNNSELKRLIRILDLLKYK